LLGGESLERAMPVLEPECVGQHGADIDPALLDHLQVVANAVHADTVHLFDPEGVATRSPTFLTWRLRIWIS